MQPLGPSGPGPTQPPGPIQPPGLAPPYWQAQPAWPAQPYWQAQPRGPQQPQGRTILISLAAVTLGIWIVAATAVMQAATWVTADVLMILGLPMPSWVWAVVALANGLLVAGPAALLWLLSRRLTPALMGVRAAGRAWAVAGLAGGVIGCVRAVPVLHNEIVLGLTAVIGFAAFMVIAGSGRRRSTATDAGAGGDARTTDLGAAGAGSGLVGGFAVAAGLAALLPWLWAGALGGASETVLAVAAALVTGLVASTVLTRELFRAYARSRPWQVLVGGLVAGVALAALGAGIGGPGVHLAEIVVLAALGFAVAGLTPGRLGVTLLVGLAALGPLAFVDPEETSTVLGFSDVGLWTFVAGCLAVLAALMMGAGYGLALRPGRPRGRWVPATAAMLVAVAAIGVYAGAGRPGLFGDRLFVILADQPDLSGLSAIDDRPARLAATYRRLVEHAERTQAPLRATLDGWHVRYTPYYLVNGLLVDAGSELRAVLSRRSDVDRVLIDQRLRPLPVSPPTLHGSGAAPAGEPQWNISLVRADRAWRELGTRGEGIVVGTSDSGVDGAHAALREGFRGGDDSWFDPWNATSTPIDHGGHGTHTLGTAVGRNGVGVAPAAQWIGCVNLDRNLGSPSLYLDCLQFMLAPFPHGGDPWRDGRPARAPHVLTNSWACPEIEGCDADALRPATAALRAAGIFMAVAAGNTGPFCSSVDDAPAPHPDVFTVGAVDRSRQVAEFSSRGPTGAGLTKPDIVAPGVAVFSSLPGNTYGVFDGTSMATPHVAGVVALMWSASPRLIGDIDTTERILRQTAGVATVPSESPGSPDSSGSPGSPGSPGSADTCGGLANIIGAGLVDAYAAVREATLSG